MNYFIQLFVGKIIRAKFLLLLCLFAQITLLMSYVHATTDFIPMEIPQGEIWGDLDGELFIVGNNGNILHYDGANYSYMSSGTQYNLSDIWGSNRNDVYALGYQVDGPTVLGSIVLHYDGTQWSKIFSNNNRLSDIWGSSQNDVFVVGSSGAIIHYDGNNWTEMSSGTTASLTSVWGSSSNDVYAVGTRGTILHFNGTEWTAMSSGTGETLSAIWGSSGSDVYAAGSNGKILHFDGTQWSVISRLPTDVQFTDIWGSGPSDIYVSGWSNLDYDGRVYHYNGSSWSSIASSFNTTGNDIWGRNSAEIYALADGRIYKKDGNSWVQVLSPPGSGTFSDMWGVGNEIFAVGTDAFYHYDGNIWSYTDLGTASIGFRGVWGDSKDNIYGVGELGYIYHYDGSKWSKMVSLTAQSLSGVWGANNGEVFAVGRNGTILHYDGTSWSAMPSGTTNSLTKVWGSSENDVFAVGSSGTILHYNGITWSKMTSGSTVNLASVFGLNSNNVFAVGENGTILNYDGTSWSIIDSPTTDSLKDIWIDSSNNIYITSFDPDYDGFYIYKYDGNEWSPMSSPHELAYSVWGIDNRKIFVSTERGVVYHPLSPCTISSPSQTGAGNIIPSSPQVVSYNGKGKYIITPLESYHIDKISGSCPQGTLSDNLDGSYTYLTGSVLSDCTIVVDFTQTFTLSYSAGAEGSIVGESLQEVYPGGDGSAVEAVPNIGYKFVSWSDGRTDNPRIDTNVANEIQVTANFVESIKIYPSVSGSGSITPSSSQEIPYNSTAEFILTPDPHNSLSNVSGTCPSGTTVDNDDGSFTYTTGKITEDCTLIANFSIDTYTLQYSTSIEGYLQGITNQIVSYGSGGTEVLAIPFEHYNFLKWSDGSSENPRIDSNITQNISVNALYVGDVHNVVFKKIHNDTIVDSITNLVEYGHVASFNITPDVGYFLFDVTTTCNGGTVSGNTYTTYAIGSDCTVTARYANKYSVNVSVINNGGFITPSATQIVTFGQKVQYLLAPDTGFHVNEINSTCGAGTLVNNIYTTSEITKDCDIAVGFSNIYSVTPSIGSGAGTISPSTVQQVEFNKTTQFTITPDPGYHIENVTGSCLGTLEENIYTTNRISDNCTVIVNFAQSIFSINTISFENEGFIPIKYTGFGNDFSPPLTWEYPPEGTKSYVLVMSDLDAKDPYWGDEWKHWIVYNIPVSQNGLPENSGAKNSVNLPAGAKHGATSWWEAGILPGNYYQGPKPPTDTGAHRYVIRLFALDIPEIYPFDDTGMGCSYYEVAQSMVGHVLGFADLKGKYEESFPWNLFMPAIITPHNKQK